MSGYIIPAMLWVLNSIPPLWINGHEVGPVKSGITDVKYHVLQFSGPVFPHQKAELRSMGIRFYNYYPKNAFLVKAPPKALREALRKPYVARVVPLLPAYKLPLHFREKLNTCYYREGDSYRVRLVLADPGDVQSVRRVAEASGLEVISTDAHVPYVEVSGEVSKILPLSENEDVIYLEFRHPLVLFNNRKAVVHQSGFFTDLQDVSDPNDTVVWKKGIKGQNEILGHNDDGLDRNHCFFSGNVGGQPKVVDLCDYDSGGCGVAGLPAGSGCDGFPPGTGCHGTHTAGTALGYSDATSSASETYKGLAPMARLISQTPLAGGSAGFTTVLQDAYDRGARVHTNSWGSVCFFGFCAPSDYSTESRATDLFVWNNPDMTVVFAAGNHGDATCISGCYREASDPASAKNDITVGAMERTSDAKTSWSAYGSYPSGRFSVDLMTVGGLTYSAEGGTPCDITTSNTWEGTSMAAPAAAGAALLIRQYYREGWYGDGTQGSAASHNPSAALVKASLLASAVPISGDGDNGGDNPVPNGNEGAGRLVLDNVMYFSPEDDWNSPADSSDVRKSRLWFVDNTSGISTSQQHTYSIDICNQNVVTRFVLVWSDYPGSTGCARGGGCLVNDLDLEVLGPGGEVFIGNAPTSGVDNLTPDDNTISPDRVNTWEIVRIKNATPGTYTVRVKGYNVPQGPQPYALVVSGGLGPCTAVESIEVEKTGTNLTVEGRTLKVEGKGRITVYTADGRKVVERTFNGRTDITLKPGVYFVRLSSKGVSRLARYVIR